MQNAVGIIVDPKIKIITLNKKFEMKSNLL